MVSGALLASGAAVLSLITYVDPAHDAVTAAGYVEKTTRINGVRLSYAEGPNNGPPLVLLHAQLLDWFSYSRVLPELAKSFHVFDIDYPGHGKTTTSADYLMTANRIGSDLAEFIERHIGQPVYISGNSSGGLLAGWLAANRADLIKAALLEILRYSLQNILASSKRSPIEPFEPAMRRRRGIIRRTSYYIGFEATLSSSGRMSAPARRRFSPRPSVSIVGLIPAAHLRSG